MKKQILLSIPTPCHENWNEMTPVEKGRFCGSCQKQVVDFSRMSDREVAIFFKKPSTGSVCGRFMSDQLDRAIEIPKKRIPWLKYFFTIAIPAFLFSMKATSQGKVNLKKVACGEAKYECTQTLGTIAIAPVKKTNIKIKPQITITGDIIRRVPEIIENPKSVLDDTITLPEVVIFAYEPMRMGKLSVGFTKNVVKTADTLCVEGMLGEVVTTHKKEPTVQPSRPKIDELISPERFKIFPNPVESGGSLNIEFLRPQFGEYLIQLISSSGQSIFNQELSPRDNIKSFEFHLPQIVSGNYFLVLTNKKSGKSYTGKLLVE